MGVFQTDNVRQKRQLIQQACHQALLGNCEGVPFEPARDVVVMDSRDMRDKPGLGSIAGRARLLHDMASIELQAMELGLRTLCEFPEAPKEFREQLAEVTASEGEHLELCLNGIEELGFKWGEWPVHLGLWKAVDVGDDFLDRILIVHRYLEGSGLDAGERLLQRLAGLPQKDASWHAMERIHREEVGHVDFGSRWYRQICRERRLEPGDDFRDRMQKLRRRLPYRTEQIARGPRLAAGFTETELQVLQEWRDQGAPGFRGGGLRT